jgi:hypothetical protein
VGTRWIWGLSIAALIGALGWWLLAEGDDGPAPSRGVPETAGDPAGTAPAAPSRFARREIRPADLDLYLRYGRELGLDWAVFAAADQLEPGAGGGSTPEDRVGAIAYGLRGAGGHADYATALASRGGGAGYARRVLRLADRYREPPALPRAVAGPLALPVDGRS